MTSTSKNFIAALSTAAVLSLGLAGAASAQQGMATATESQLNATWVDGSAAPTTSTGASDRSALGQTSSFGYPVDVGVDRSVAASARQGASWLFESENGTWVDASGRSTTATPDGL